MAPKRAVAASVKKTKTAASTSRVQKPAANTSAKRWVAKKSTSTASAKDVTSKKSKSKVVPEPSMPASTKRKVESEPVSAPRAPKRQRTEDPLNTAPSQKLDIFVIGSGESGELGLGHVIRNGKKPTDVRRPRLNDLLDASAVGVVQMAVGGMHCVALTHDGKILTWGVNDNGALGRETSWEAPTKDIDASESDEDTDSDGESGLNPKESTPTAISPEFFSKDAGDLVQVAATDSASFVLTSKGFVYGWGTFSGSDGNIGFSKNVHKGTKLDTQQRPALIPQLKNITSLAAGGNHMLALDSHGAIYAWGCGQQSQLGRPVMESYRTAALTPSLVRIPGAKGKKNRIASVAAGQFHSFALTAAGEVYAWGLNNFAQTGIAPKPAAGEDGEQDPSALIVAKPTLVESLAGYAGGEHGHVTAVAGGNHHSLALTSAGHMLSWAGCDASQAGMPLSSLPRDSLVFDDRGKARILARPTPIPELKDVAFVATGIDNSIAITEAGRAYSWGFSASYRTGLGTEDPIETPTLVENSAVKDKELTWAGCGGQFSVLAGPAGN